MNPSVEAIQQLLLDANGESESTELSRAKVRELGDLLLPALRALYDASPDDLTSRLMVGALWEICTPGTVDLLIEMSRDQSFSARSWAFFMLSITLEVDGPGDWILYSGGWIEPLPTARQTDRAPTIRHMSTHPLFKETVFLFSESVCELENVAYCIACTKMKWKDALPFMRVMRDRHDAATSSQIEEYRRELASS